MSSLPNLNDPLEIVYRPDASLTDDEDRQLRHLLFSCFPYEPAFLARRFLKESPPHRWLVRDGMGRIVAHTALHEKTIGAGKGDLRIGGVAEICVAAGCRGAGLVKQMLHIVHAWMRERGFAFAILFGQPKVYASSGYALIENEVRAENSLLRHWNPFCGKPMVCTLLDAEWPTGAIDLRGPTF